MNVHKVSTPVWSPLNQKPQRTSPPYPPGGLLINIPPFSPMPTTILTSNTAGNFEIYVNGYSFYTHDILKIKLKSKVCLMFACKVWYRDVSPTHHPPFSLLTTLNFYFKFSHAFLRFNNHSLCCLISEHREVWSWQSSSTSFHLGFFFLHLFLFLSRTLP